jgi:hypothetical protein
VPSHQLAIGCNGEYSDQENRREDPVDDRRPVKRTNIIDPREIEDDRNDRRQKDNAGGDVRKG